MQSEQKGESSSEKKRRLLGEMAALLLTNVSDTLRLGYSKDYGSSSGGLQDLLFSVMNYHRYYMHKPPLTEIYRANSQFIDEFNH